MELYLSERAAELAKKIKKPLRDRVAAVGKPHYITKQIVNGALVDEFVQTYYKHIRNSSRRRSLKLRIPFLVEDIESWAYELFYSHRKDGRVTAETVREKDNPSGFVTKVVTHAALKTLNFHLMLGESPIEIDNSERENNDGDDLGGMDFAAGEPDPTFEEIVGDFKMSETERTVLDAHLGGRTYEEIGAEISESDSSVFRILDKLKQRMKKCNLPRPTARRWNGLAVYNTNPERLMRCSDGWFSAIEWSDPLSDFVIGVTPVGADTVVGAAIGGFGDERTSVGKNVGVIMRETIKRFRTYNLTRPMPYEYTEDGVKFWCRRITFEDARKSGERFEVWRITDAVKKSRSLSELVAKIQEGLSNVTIDIGTFAGEIGTDEFGKPRIYNSGEVVITVEDLDPRVAEYASKAKTFVEAK